MQTDRRDIGKQEYEIGNKNKETTTAGKNRTKHDEIDDKTTTNTTVRLIIGEASQTRYKIYSCSSNHT